MNENVIIKIHSTQYTSGEKSVIESTAIGKYHAFPDMHSILYEEKASDEDEENVVLNRNIMKIQKDKLILIKKGLIKTEMTFQNGNIHHGSYQTPYGTFAMAIHTKSLHISLAPEEIKISINYALELGGQHTSDCQMSIHIHNL